MAPKDKNNFGKGKLLLAFLRSSLILTSLDLFTSYIYTLIKKGFFGYIFSGYCEDSRSQLKNRWSVSKAASHFTEFRYGICRRIESSILVYYVNWIMKFLLGCKLKVYGVFFASFGAYTAVVIAIGAILNNDIASLVQHQQIGIAMILILSSLPLILSKKRLSEALVSSVIGRIIIKITGFTESEIFSTVGDGGHSSSAFLIGIICGALTYSISPFFILIAIVALIWAYLVLIRPEIGVVTLFFFMPFFPTMLLAAIVIYTTLCWIIKLFRGKRVFRLEPVDIMALAFIVLLFFGGVISLSTTSLKPALLMVCLAMGYFLTIELITSREWLVRCSLSSIFAASLTSLYGLFMYFTGTGYASDAWVDSDMFSSIGRRAVSTLENPNMLGEYLILILPIAVSMFIGRGEGLRKLSALSCIAVMGVCLIFTWSRGAWLGLIVAALVFLFMWHRRAVWLVLAGIVSVPILPSILPASIVSRFTSIGNMADSSTSYRMYIWRASVDMIGDHILTGIGIGEGAWHRLYPLYTYQGVEAAPHSHNLFLQIWLELGLIGILVFLAFLFMLYQSGFTLFSRLNDSYPLNNPDISETLLKHNLAIGKETLSQKMQRGKTQLRISTAGPLCGIIAVLAQGMTDYAWYNYRLYLMFWLVCGLSAAYVRSGRSFIGNTEEPHEADTTKCAAEFLLDDEKDAKLNRSQKFKTRKQRRIDS